jgi:hypothetical protein
VLPGIALGRGDLWPAHPSLLGQYARVPEAWQPGDPPVVVRGRPGRVVEGEVLHADGRPAVDVPVGQRECHRGPWTRTGAGGRFRLLGADGSSSIEVVVAQGGSRRSLHYELPPAGFFRRLRLPKSADDEPEPREPGRPVKVSTTLANAWGPVAGAEVVAVRLEDGCPTWERTDDAGACTLELAPGRYELLARHPSGEVEPASTELEVSEAGAALAHLMLRPRPKVRLDVQGLPAGGRVALVAEGGERELDGDGRHEPVAVPLGGRRAFRLEAEDRARAFPIAASPPETMTLAWYAPHEVAVAFVDPAGRPTRARAVVAGASGEGLRSAELPPDVEAAERAVVRTTRAGPAFVVAFPEDGRLAPAAARLVLPEGEGKRVDAGTIALELRDAPRLRVQFEDGRPAAGARVELSLVGFSTKDELDAAGAWAALPAPREGDWVVVSDPEGRRVPIRTGLAGPGPWTLRWPEGSLAVEVRGADGRAIEGPAVFLDGETRERSWRGVAPGPHRLIVTAPGRKAYVLDLVWGERDARTIRITLD